MTIQAATPEERFQNEAREYDALLVVSFGGPEGMDDVIPFMENVLRGRNIPRARLEEVSEHYRLFDGVSPINEQNRQLIAALEKELAEHGPKLPIYWGNRNWKPYLKDTLQQMYDDGVRLAAAFFTSAYSCYSGCRQYRENIINALAELGIEDMQVEKLRMFYNHPGFIEPNLDHLRVALEQIPEDRRDKVHVAFTAHSIPMGMADNSAYVKQLTETCRILANEAELTDWALVYQSRSGPPHMPWLEPDICDHIEALKAQGYEDIVMHPVGFISDHMEVIYDLDTEAMQVAEEIGVNLVRAASVGTHPRFVRMIRELIEERMAADPMRAAMGRFGPNHDVCPVNCCLEK